MLQNNGAYTMDQQQQDDETDDEINDELGVEFMGDPTLDQIMHLFSLLDLFSTPAPEPRPTARP